jgi:hypothetical protein
VQGKLIPRYSEVAIEPRVGIFFFVDGEIIMDAVPVEKGERRGDAIQHGNHYEFWKSLEPTNSYEEKFKAGHVDRYPRGRVDYFPSKNQFCIYYDPCLELNVEIIVVSEKFDLEGVDIELENAENYKCANCRPQ